MSAPIHFSLEIIEIDLGRWSFLVHFWITRNRNTKLRIIGLDQGYEFVCVSKTSYGLLKLRLSLWGITTKGNNVVRSEGYCVIKVIAKLFDGGTNTRQVACNPLRKTVFQGFDDLDRPVAGRPPCPVVASEKIGLEFFEFTDGAHQCFEGFVGFGWEYLEGESKVTGPKEFVQPHDMTSDKIQFSNACC